MDMSSDILDFPSVINVGPLANIHCVTLNPGMGHQQTQIFSSTNLSSAPSVVGTVTSVSGKAKFPIPKITKAGNPFLSTANVQETKVQFVGPDGSLRYIVLIFVYSFLYLDRI